MQNPMEAQGRAFFVVGAVPDGVAAEVQAYLIERGFKVTETSPQVGAVICENLIDLVEAPRDEIFTKDQFRLDVSDNGCSLIWNGIVNASREQRLPLELRKTSDNKVAITYQSAAQLLTLLASGTYRGHWPSHLARHRLTRVVDKWREAQEQAVDNRVAS